MRRGHKSWVEHGRHAALGTRRVVGALPVGRTRLALWDSDSTHVVVHDGSIIPTSTGVEHRGAPPCSSRSLWQWHPVWCSACCPRCVRHASTSSTRCATAGKAAPRAGSVRLRSALVVERFPSRYVARWCVVAGAEFRLHAAGAARVRHAQPARELCRAPGIALSVTGPCAARSTARWPACAPFPACAAPRSSRGFRSVTRVTIAWRAPKGTR